MLIMVDHNCFLWMLVCLSLLLSNDYYYVGLEAAAAPAASTMNHQRNATPSPESRTIGTRRTQFGVHYYQHLATPNQGIYHVYLLLSSNVGF